MSLRRDYLLRLLEQMQRAIARVRELLEAGRTADARTELQRAARDAGLDLHLALSLAPASMIPLLSNAGQLDRGKCALFTELLDLERERALTLGSHSRSGTTLASGRQHLCALEP